MQFLSKNMCSSILLLNILRVSSLVQTLNIEDIEARPCVKKLPARGLKQRKIINSHQMIKNCRDKNYFQEVVV